MRFFCPILAGLVLLLRVCAANELPKCGTAALDPSEASGVELLILGGRTVTHEMFPWVGYLAFGDPGVPKCTVSLIHTKWVLTAAHCVKDHCPSNIFIVVLGVINHDDRKEENTFKVIRALYPKSLTVSVDESNAINDIALLELEREAKIYPENPEINIVCLPPENMVSRMESKVYVAGWGMVTDEAGASASKNLKYIVADKLPAAQCKRFSQFCVKGVKHNDTVLWGDSGGPAMVMVLQKYYIQGVLSGSDKSTGISYFTDVFNHKDWIYNLNDNETVTHKC